MGFPSPSLNVVIDYFCHSCLKMYKICLNSTLDATFLDCLALTFCDIIGELLPKWACLTLQCGTTFLLTSKLADIPVSRVRNLCLTICSTRIEMDREGKVHHFVQCMWIFMQNCCRSFHDKLVTSV